MSYLEQSTRYIPYDTPPPDRPLPLLPGPRGARLAARGPLRRRDGPDVRHLRRAAAAAPGAPDAGVSPRPGGGLRVAYRQSVRARALDALRGLLPAGALSNVGIYGSGQSYELLLLRDAGAPAAGGPPLRRADAGRAAQGDPVVPHPGRPARPRRRLVRVPRRAARARWTALVEELWPDARRARPGRCRRCASPTSTRPARTRCSRRCATRTRTLPESEVADRVARLDRLSSATRSCGAYVGEREQPPPPPRAGLRAHGVPLRHRRRTTGRSATCSATAC